MAKEYIERNSLWKALDVAHLFDNGNPRHIAQQVVEEQPVADVVEVVQELWKKTANEKPDSTRHLIVANGSLISHYGYYLKPKDKWYKTYECEEEIEVPTYWMDMPTPPKESIYGECAVMDGKKVE